MAKIETKLLNDIKEYCKLNNIQNINEFINNLIRNSFTIEKYGEKPPILTNDNKKYNTTENKPNHTNDSNITIIDKNENCVIHEKTSPDADFKITLKR